MRIGACKRRDRRNSGRNRRRGGTEIWNRNTAGVRQGYGMGTTVEARGPFFAPKLEALSCRLKMLHMYPKCVFGREKECYPFHISFFFFFFLMQEYHNLFLTSLSDWLCRLRANVCVCVCAYGFWFSFHTHSFFVCLMVVLYVTPFGLVFVLFVIYTFLSV